MNCRNLQAGPEYIKKEVGLFKAVMMSETDGAFVIKDNVDDNNRIINDRDETNGCTEPASQSIGPMSGGRDQSSQFKSLGTPV